MADIACFVERYTVSRAEELTALANFKLAAHQLGHKLEYVFRADIGKIPMYDALFIRSLTDPLNAAYVAARTAELHGMTVIDDPDSIIICCDKINMYLHLMRENVPIPETRFVGKRELDRRTMEQLFDELGSPLVLKAPHTSFSMHVDKVDSASAFEEVARKYYRRADEIVVQRYIPSRFDWRVTTLNGEPLFVCKYVMPGNHWKIQRSDNGHVTWAKIEAQDLKAVDPKLIEAGLKASRAIGKGLYGVDIKEVDGKYIVIEVNDNPNIDAGGEDARNPEVYGRIIRYLAGE
ncbi:ATP-grasp domain-containing protein [Methanomassiliicoccus luminyensis]|uniref:ATP-grasp domain-containing protein n=1 Tax=Methanomassiliicoccus luminyensis TaxID=1080712 RepID=UPI0003710C2F|nr:RimK family alpha-L-glutamate ligase [Methanomassiliicoccus luminyensis]